MARTSERREENDQAVDRNISSSDGHADGQDVAGGKRKKRCRKGKKKLDLNLNESPPIDDQPPVSVHGASNFQDQPMTHSTSIAQSQLMQPGASASQPALPPNMIHSTSIAQSQLMQPGASASQPALRPNMTHSTSTAQSQLMQPEASASQPALPPNMTLTNNSYLVRYPYYENNPQYKLEYYLALPVVQYTQPVSQEPPSDPNTTGALPSTLAPVIEPYKPANSTNMQGPTPQSIQLLLPLHSYQIPQPSPEATQQPSNSVAIQNQVSNVPSSREDDETSRSNRHGSKRKRGRSRKNARPE